MQCRVTKRQEEREIKEAKHVRTERTKQEGIWKERGDASQDGSPDEE